MKRKLATIIITLMLFGYTSLAYADEIKVSLQVEVSPTGFQENKPELSGRVAGISVEKDIDFKKFGLTPDYEKNKLNVVVVLKNLSEESITIDEAQLDVSTLDGSEKFSHVTGVNSSLKPNGEDSFVISFPGETDKGEYVANIHLFSNGKLLGESKTLLSIKVLEPQVLGASASNINYFSVIPWIIVLPLALSIFLIAISFLIIAKRDILMKKGLTIRLFDFIAVLMLLAMFGLGLFAGYNLVRLLNF